MGVSNYKKNSDLVQAIQYNGSNDDDIVSWSSDIDEPAISSPSGLFFNTSYGQQYVPQSDWVIKFDGVLKICDPESFSFKYTQAE